MTALIGEIISLASSICGIIATKEALKYVDDLKDYQTSLVEEDAKGDLADDSKIEALHKSIQITLEAINNQYALQTNKATTAASSSASSTSTTSTT